MSVINPCIPLKHDQEHARLEALYRYGILDTPQEAAYDDITRLAAYICQTPIAVVNLIDRERQWFKSEIGLGVRETPLDISICAHAILQPGLFMVPDTLQDPRFATNPLVTGEPHLRFYAGALLESSDGYPIGTLCVLDYTPRTLTQDQQDALLTLSRQIMAQIEVRRHVAEIQTLNQRLLRTMAESHHRIKNNLQVLSALVEMQIMNNAATVPISELTRLSQHIRSLAIVHDLLTLDARNRSELHRLSARKTLERLVAMLQSIMGDRRLQLDVADIHLPLKQITSLTMLVNELISNAVKHSPGDVDVSLSVDNETARLTVQDSGPGFPADFNPATAANTGLDLVESLGRWDLHGDIRYENRPEGGAQVVVTFPCPPEPVESVAIPVQNFPV